VLCCRFTLTFVHSSSNIVFFVLLVAIGIIDVVNTRQRFDAVRSNAS
jgi:hypothetical protein